MQQQLNLRTTRALGLAVSDCNATELGSHPAPKDQAVSEEGALSLTFIGGVSEWGNPESAAFVLASNSTQPTVGTLQIEMPEWATIQLTLDYGLRLICWSWLPYEPCKQRRPIQKVDCASSVEPCAWTKGCHCNHCRILFSNQ